MTVLKSIYNQTNVLNGFFLRNLAWQKKMTLVI